MVSMCPKDSKPEYAFIGRSNVGKSSVINRLLNRKNFARVGSAPGKTTHINYFLIDEKLYLVDLPGYGYAKVSQGEKERKVQHMISGYGRRVLMPVLVLALANIGVEVIPFRYTWAVVSLFVLPLIALHAYGGYCSLQTLKSSNSSS